MTFYAEDILKVLLAMALGGMLGAERELRDKDAGLRTLMYISAGAAIFTILSLRTAELYGPADPARIAAQVVTGIGFLGAGVILREHGQVRGLTTAATIWLAAALGMGAGAGQYLTSIITAVLITLTLLFFPRLENLISELNRITTYQVVTSAGLEKYHRLLDLIKSLDLTVLSSKRTRKGDQMICLLIISGRPKAHEHFFEHLFNDSEVAEVDTI